MNSTPAEHDQNHSGEVALYAVHAMAPREMAEAEARISHCAACLQELEALRPVVASFVSWPTNVLRPSVNLWDRLARRIGEGTGVPPLSSPLEPVTKARWELAAPGIHVQILAKDDAGKRVSMLVRLEPGTEYPPHRHAGIEELYMLDGILIVDDKSYQPGDFLHAEAGSEDHRVYSETGCTCVLLTSTDDKLLL